MTSKPANIMDDLQSKQIFKKFTYRGLKIGELLEKDDKQLAQLFRARQRRKINREMHPKYERLINKLWKVKVATPQGEKPKVVKTHLRNAIVVPKMVQSVIGVYTGKEFVPVEVKPNMIGYYLGEFAASKKRIAHGKAGVGATKSSKFQPIK